jgi:hypothetical protein
MNKKPLLAKLVVEIRASRELDDQETDAAIEAYEELDVLSRVEMLVLDLVESRTALDYATVTVREE